MIVRNTEYSDINVTKYFFFQTTTRFYSLLYFTQTKHKSQEEVNSINILNIVITKTLVLIFYRAYYIFWLEFPKFSKYSIYVANLFEFSLLEFFYTYIVTLIFCITTAEFNNK